MKQIIGRLSNVSVWFVAPLNGESNSLDATTVYFRLRIETCNFLMSSHSMGFTPDEPKQIPRQHGDMHFEQASFEGRDFSLSSISCCWQSNREANERLGWWSPFDGSQGRHRILNEFSGLSSKPFSSSATWTERGVIDPFISRLSQTNHNPWGLFINSWHPIRPFN